MPLAGLHDGRNLPEVPAFGKLCASDFQALENHGTQTLKTGTDESYESERNNHEIHTHTPGRSALHRRNQA
jgi:hypothetical protein